VESLSVDELLLILKVGFLVLLYLFIWRIVRQASRDIRTVGNESFVLRPGDVPPELRANPVRPPAERLGRAGRLVVLSSPSLEEGRAYALDSVALTVGRGAQNDLPLRGDGFASAVHARVEPRNGGVWLTDEGSTNGTFLNGERLERERKLDRGDVIKVGETELRFEP
jgi:hypothetical protein